MALNIKPLGDRLLVEPVEEKEVKKGGIIIPDTAKEKPQEGLVRALGTGKLDDNGKRIAFEVKVGDRASFASKFRRVGASFFAKAIDNRIGCAILIEILKIRRPRKSLILSVRCTRYTKTSTDWRCRA